MEINKIYNEDCLEGMKRIADNSVDSVVTDPPYELGFMGKSWDSTGIAYNVEMWKEVLRVLKPGGHLLAFGGTRTYHRMACAIEDAGFEIRDMMQWLYGSGMPHGKNIGDGWNTALKPANEPMVLARKPISEKTVADNVMRWGTGGINIGGCRIGTKVRFNDGAGNKPGGNALMMSKKGMPQDFKGTPCVGRFPANIILDEVAGELLDAQTGTLASGGVKNSGGASRFFYCAKASRKERDMGLTELPLQICGALQGRHDGSLGSKTLGKNVHPTVKPLKLMKYLVRLVTPPNGTVLDPFSGSGTTAIACMNTQRNFIGFEMDKGYYDIACKRIEYHKELS